MLHPAPGARADRLEKGPPAPARIGRTLANALARLRLMATPLYEAIKTLLSAPPSP